MSNVCREAQSYYNMIDNLYSGRVERAGAWNEYCNFGSALASGDESKIIAAKNSFQNKFYGDHSNGYGGRRLHLMPIVYRDGTLSLYDKCSGEHAIIRPIKTLGGHALSFKGNEKFMTMLGGRGELGEITKMYYDGSYFQDLHYNKAKR